MESTRANRFDTKQTEVCPIGMTRLLQEQYSAQMAVEYKQIANAIGLLHEEETEVPNSPKSPRSPVMSPKSPRKSKSAKKYDHMDKVDGIIMLLELLGNMEIELGRKGLDTALDVVAEVRKIYVWLSDEKNLENVKRELKQKLEKKESKDVSAKLAILEKMIEKGYTPDLITYAALAMYSASHTKETPDVHGSFKTLKLNAAAEIIDKDLKLLQLKLEKKVAKRKPKNEKSDEKLNRKINDLEKKIHFKKSYQSKVRNLINSIGSVNFYSMNTLEPTSPRSVKLYKTSVFAHPEFNETLNARLEDIRYANFRKYEKLLKLAIEILKNPEFLEHEDKKAEEELVRIITFLQLQLDNLLAESTKLREKLQQEKELYHFANEVISKIDFTQLSVTFANTGSRKAETKLIKDSLGEEYQVDAHNEEGEGNAAVYVIYKKPVQQVTEENMPEQEVTEEGSKEEEKDVKVTEAQVESPTPVTKAKPQPVGPAIVIRAQNMNIYDLETMTSPKHLIQRTSSALDFSEPGFTKQYALMPGIAPDVPTGEDKVYRNYEVSEAVFGGDLKKLFENLHENVALETINKDGAIALLQLNFVSYAKKLIQFFMELKEKGICYTDLKPSNVLRLVKISDDKTAVNVSNLAENELFYPRETQSLQLTSGFYAPSVQKRDANGKICYDMDQLAKDTLVFTLFQMITCENLEDPKHRFDTDSVQSKMLLEIKDSNLPMFQGEFGKSILHAYDLLLAFKSSKEVSLEQLFEVFSSIEKELNAAKVEPVETKKEIGLRFKTQQ